MEESQFPLKKKETKKKIKNKQRGWVGYGSYTARKITPNCRERSHLTELCFSLITFAPVRGAETKFYSFICGLREEVEQTTP